MQVALGSTGKQDAGNLQEIAKVRRYKEYSRISTLISVYVDMRISAYCDSLAAVSQNSTTPFFILICTAV